MLESVDNLLLQRSPTHNGDITSACPAAYERHVEACATSRQLDREAEL
jgi:hypothetical protein